jgi:hypothetical protein
MSAIRRTSTACAFCALLLAGAAGCRRDNGTSRAAVRSGAVGTLAGETPSQVFWANATNRIGLGGYSELAAPIPGRASAQVTWLDERRVAFMRAAGEDAPVEIDHAVSGEGAWSSPVAASFPGLDVLALLDGSALGGGGPKQPMIVFVGDDADWSQVLGSDAGLSDHDIIQLQNRNHRLYSSFLVSGRWTAPLPVPDSFGALGGALQAGPGFTALLLAALDPDGDPSTREDRALRFAWFDGSRWSSPVPLASGPGLPYGLQVSFAGGAYHLAWVVDADRDLETTGDRTVWAAAVSAGGVLLQGPAPVSEPLDQPWPILGSVGGVPVLLFTGAVSPQGLRPLLQSQHAGSWSTPAETGLRAGSVARGELFDEGGETLLVYEDSNALATATTRGGAWHSAGFVQDYNARDFSLSEAAVSRTAGGLEVAALGHARAAGTGAADQLLAVHLPIAPDLAISRVSTTERRLAAGRSLQLQVTVENRGQLHSGPFTVALDDGSAPVSETDGLYPGERRQYALPILVGRPRQRLEASVAGTRPDLDPSNDRMPYDLRVLPDFTVDSVTRDGNALVARVVDLKDVGAEPVNVDFVLVKGGAKTVLSQATFDPSQAVPVRFAWSAWPPDAEPYAVTVVVNDRTGVPEDDATNNMSTYRHEPSADFVVQRLEVGTSTVSGAVANVGALPAAAVQLLLTTDPELAVSPEPVPGATPLFLGTVTLIGGAGAFEVPAGGLQAAPGYFLYAVVNPYGTAPELNRDNNMLRVPKRPAAAALHPALYALESLRIGEGATVTGPVAVGTDGPAEDDLVVGPSARVEGDAAAHHVRLLPGAAVTGAVTSNALEVGPRATPGASRAPLPLPLDVLIPPVGTQPGTDDLRVTGTVELAPGSHRDVQVGPGATLRLAGGAHAFRSVSLQAGGRMECAQPCEVRIAQSLTTAADAYVGASPGSPLQPSAVQLRVAGATVRLDHGAAGRGALAAPAAAVALGSDVQWQGTVIGRSIDVGHGAVAGGPAGEAAPATRALQVAIQSESRTGGHR